MNNQLQLGDTIAAKGTALDLLLFDSAQDLYMYYDEFVIANRLIDSRYNEETGPLIKLNMHEVELMECEIGKTIPLSVNVTNVGKMPLKISDILIGCSCVRLVSEKKHTIDCDESLTISIEFTPDVKGCLSRKVCFVSNSINTLVSTFTINAYVK